MSFSEDGFKKTLDYRSAGLVAVALIILAAAYPSLSSRPSAYFSVLFLLAAFSAIVFAAACFIRSHEVSRLCAHVRGMVEEERGMLEASRQLKAKLGAGRRDDVAKELDRRIKEELERLEREA